jgi:hypothetical protein
MENTVRHSTDLADPKLGVILIVLLGWRVVPGQAAENWQPAQGPLITQWAGDVSPTNAHSEYPRPTLVRKDWQNLNGLWDYAVTAKEAERAPQAYDGKILVPYCIESALSGVMKPFTPKDRLWYHRIFTVPPEWAGQRVLLHFGAVDQQAAVFVNGKPLGTHRGGYDAFSFDITKLLKNDGTQEIVVSVLDPTETGWDLRGKQTQHPGGAFYTATSGIWQTVWLEPVPESSIEALRMVADADAGVLHLTVSGRTAPEVMGITASALEGATKVAGVDGVLNSEITPIQKENLTWYKARMTWGSVNLDLPIPNPKLWTPDSPFLYDLTIELKDRQGKVLDTVGSYFGLRTIAVGHIERNTVPLLNGKPIILEGALEQGFWPDGIYTAPTDEAQRFDVAAARRLGLNCIRKHIKVEPERYYYWCDKLGLMVIQDMPSGDDGDSFTDMPKTPEAATTCEMERRTLIQQRWNHPSIICWAMFNEGWGQHDTLRTAVWAKELDPSRLIDEASGFPRHGGGEVLDCHGGVPPRDPKRISIDSETAGFGLTVPGHSWPGKGWATGTYDAATDSMTRGRYNGLYPLDEPSKRWYTKEMVNFYKWLWKARDETGCSGNFKVQLYDVENECNGMLSYDRAVWKVDPEAVAKASRGK